ncbi:HAD family hydrolase [soil metagenome]
MQRTGVLLDIDGTLLDTNPLHTVAWWRALRRLGHTFPMWRIHPLIGMGGDKLAPELAGHEVEGATDVYGEEFDRLRDEVVTLPGARELVRDLSEAGVCVVLASSARAEDLEHFRQVLDIEPWIDGATSSGDVKSSKPDPDVFSVAMERHDLVAAHTVTIGDAVWDGKAAVRAEIEFVAVESGGTRAAELRDAGASVVYPDAQAILDQLTTGPLSRLLTPR